MKGVISDLKTDTSRLIFFAPGNSTQYTLVLTPLHKETCERLGCQEGSQLAFFTNFNSGAIFAASGYLAESYVHEKLRCDLLHIGSEDLKQMTAVLRFALGREIDNA